MDTYTNAVEKFLKAADWLTDADAPMVTGLQHVAKELDGGFKASTFAQFGLAFRYLANKAPKAVETEEEDEDLKFS